MSSQPKPAQEFVRNAAGRLVPTVVNGVPQVPFCGVGKYRPEGRKAAVGAIKLPLVGSASALSERRTRLVSARRPCPGSPARRHHAQGHRTLPRPLDLRRPGRLDHSR